MSIISIGGAGIPLPYPQNTVSYIPNGGTNKIALPAGGTTLIPSGTFWVAPGPYTFIQVLDPVTTLWLTVSTTSGNEGMYINSDGTNYRLANLTGCPVGAIVTNVGSGYTSAPTVTPSAGGSTWTAIVGGAVSQTVTIGTAGSNYTYPPIVQFSAPPAGGVPATGYATLSSGAVSSITVVDQGAGYTSAPTIFLTTNPLDPNLTSSTVTITPAKATAALTGSGTVTAVLCTNPGVPQTSLITLTFTSASGSNAAATVIGCFTTTAAATTGTAGSTYLNVAYKGTALGGNNTSTAGAVKNPSIGPGIFQIREANFGYVTGSGGSIANATFPIIDGGIYQNVSATSTLIGPPTTTPTTPVTFTTAFGGVADVSFITPL